VKQTDFNNAFSISPHHEFPQYARKRNFTDSHKAFPKPIFMKLATARQHCVEIFYTEFRSQQIINADSAKRNSFTPTKQITNFTAPIFMKLKIT
jgi:hypothetical protein